MMNAISPPGGCFPTSGLGIDTEGILTQSQESAVSFFTKGYSFVGLALKAGAGYYLGRYFGHPIAGAALSTFLGVPGLFVLALVAEKPDSALPNRKRRRHGRRRGRRAYR
jgi:hypothetical protein